MELQHSFAVPADVETAWRTLLDVEGIAPCFPGATLLSMSGDDFTGQVTVKLGPMSLQYSGKGRFVERDEAAHRAVISAQGSDKRGNGTAGAMVVAHLTQEGPELTRVTVDTQLTITGKPAQLGRGALQTVGGKIVDQFAERLAAQLRSPSAAPTTPDASAMVPGGATVAAEVVAADEASADEVAPGHGRPQSTASASASVTRSEGPGSAPAPAPRPVPTETALDLNRIVFASYAKRIAVAAGVVVAVGVVGWILTRR